MKRMWRQEPFCTVGGKVTLYNHYGNKYGGSLKSRNRTII